MLFKELTNSLYKWVVRVLTTTSYRRQLAKLCVCVFYVYPYRMS
jgi:hypothetical protein